MNSKRFVGICVILIFLLTFASYQTPESTLHQTKSPHDIQTRTNHASEFVEHSPIVIIGDTNLSISGWSGSGTKSAPYIIENWEITESGDAIIVQDTSLYFVIRNCYIRSDSYGHDGISFINVTNGRIENCTIERKSPGLYLVDSENCTIERNVVRNCGYGLRMYSGSKNNVITNNIMEQISSYGIQVQYGDNNTVSSNTLTVGDNGIYIYGADYSKIMDNTIMQYYSHSQYGMRIQYSNYIKCTGNNVDSGFDAGIYIDELMNGTFTDNDFGKGIIFGEYLTPTLEYSFQSNIAEGKTIEVLTGVDDVTISSDDYGQVILLQCTNTTIENSQFDGVCVAVMLIGCSDCTVTGNEFNGTTYAACQMASSSDSNFTSNVITAFDGNGLYAYHVDNLYAADNDVSGNPSSNSYEYAIYIYNSWSVMIEENYIHDLNCSGIAASYGSYTISGNTIECSKFPDIILSRSDNCNVTDNEMVVGVTLDGYIVHNFKHTFSGNLISGKPLGYFVDTSDTEISCDSYHQIIVVNGSNLILTQDSPTSNIQCINVFYCDNILIDGLHRTSESNLESTFAYSSNCSIRNYEHIKGYGLQIRQSEDIDISYSTFNETSSAGIYVYDCVNITISDSVSCSNLEGLNLYYCSNCTITDNIILYSTQRGIVLGYSTSYTTLFGNKIGWNYYYYGYVANAVDSGYNNTWDNGNDFGNYWSDYSGSGVYLISGQADSVDRYPRVLEEFEPATPTWTVPVTTTYPDSDFTPVSPFGPPVDMLNATVWYEEQILGVPILYILGALTGIVTLLGVIVIFKRE